ncbi:hypothetical protein D0861_03817 [Hortaea werneckii]|uniref:Heme peroxidase n=1 Tax=Hortaea werneckii TaxID=91943 RepID=A0A3M7FMY6_HORWE|nr:hypothetical protein D0861_03817 [Hortaea werneckii]
MESPNFKPTFFQSIFIKLFKIVNSTIPWSNLPGFIGAINLDFLRIDLRNYNLHDGYASADAQGKVGEQPPVEERFIGTRNSDGKDNSLEMRRMGCAGMRFGRNFNRKYCQKPTDEELLTPNPRLVSQTFMARETHEFKPATTLNLLAAAWIQFQVHDWFNHEDDDTTFDIPLSPEDDWQGKRMSLFKTKTDMELHPSDQLCPGYRNVNTAWWDGSQIYGSSEVVTGELRSKNQDGKLHLDRIGIQPFFIPRNGDGTPKTGFSDNCDQIFDKARIVNCALMAKIHTVEWTPAILAHPALQIGMSANWWGIVGEKLTKAVGRISKTSEAISGIPGSGVDHQGIPYSLTEEFVSVYRMHSLVPVRDRERGVPRYTTFRRLLRMDVPKTFEELTGGNIELAQKLSKVYDGDIDKVDTLVGSHSEPVPPGFGFSDTAFRIFILMASRRLKSDRFIAGSWNADMYTKEGFQWVQDTNMSDVLCRHFPELGQVIPKKTNIFAPWTRTLPSKDRGL